MLTRLQTDLDLNRVQLSSVKEMLTEIEERNNRNCDILTEIRREPLIHHCELLIEMEKKNTEELEFRAQNVEKRVARLKRIKRDTLREKDLDKNNLKETEALLETNLKQRNILVDEKLKNQRIIGYLKKIVDEFELQKSSEKGIADKSIVISDDNSEDESSSEDSTDVSTSSNDESSISNTAIDNERNENVNEEINTKKAGETSPEDVIAVSSLTEEVNTKTKAGLTSPDEEVATLSADEEFNTKKEESSLKITLNTVNGIKERSVTNSPLTRRKVNSEATEDTEGDKEGEETTSGNLLTDAVIQGIIDNDSCDITDIIKTMGSRPFARGVVAKKANILKQQFLALSKDLLITLAKDNEKEACQSAEITQKVAGETVEEVIQEAAEEAIEEDVQEAVNEAAEEVVQAAAGEAMKKAIQDNNDEATEEPEIDSAGKSKDEAAGEVPGYDKSNSIVKQCRARRTGWSIRSMKRDRKGNRVLLKMLTSAANAPYLTDKVDVVKTNTKNQIFNSSILDQGVGDVKILKIANAEETGKVENETIKKVNVKQMPTNKEAKLKINAIPFQSSELSSSSSQVSSSSKHQLVAENLEKATEIAEGKVAGKTKAKTVEETAEEAPEEARETGWQRQLAVEDLEIGKYATITQTSRLSQSSIQTSTPPGVVLVSEDLEEAKSKIKNDVQPQTSWSSQSSAKFSRLSKGSSWSTQQTSLSQKNHEDNVINNLEQTIQKGIELFGLNKKSSINSSSLTNVPIQTSEKPSEESKFLTDHSAMDYPGTSGTSKSVGNRKRSRSHISDRERNQWNGSPINNSKYGWGNTVRSPSISSTKADHFWSEDKSEDERVVRRSRTTLRRREEPRSTTPEKKSRSSSRRQEKTKSPISFFNRGNQDYQPTINVKSPRSRKYTQLVMLFGPNTTINIKQEVLRTGFLRSNLVDNRKSSVEVDFIQFQSKFTERICKKEPRLYHMLFLDAAYDFVLNHPYKFKVIGEIVDGGPVYTCERNHYRIVLIRTCGVEIFKRRDPVYINDSNINILTAIKAEDFYLLQRGVKYEFEFGRMNVHLSGLFLELKSYQRKFLFEINNWKQLHCRFPSNSRN